MKSKEYENSYVEKILIELDREELEKHGYNLKRDFKIGDSVVLRNSRVYLENIDSQIELKEIANQKKKIFIHEINFNDDGSIQSYNIITQNKKRYYGFYPNELNPI